MDYIFYRIYSFYKKKGDSPLFSSIMFLGVLKVSILFFLVSILNILTGGFFSGKNPDLDKKYFYLIFILVSIVLLIMDSIRYCKAQKIKDIEQKYAGTYMNRIIKTWHIFLFPLFIFVMTVLISIMSSNNVGGMLINR